MRILALACVTLLFAGGSSAFAESASSGEPPAEDAPVSVDEATRRIAAAALVDGQAWDKLAWLTDRIGHRLAGSEQLDQAIAWAVEQFRRDGIDQVRTEKVVVPAWIRGDESAAIVAPARHDLALLGLGGSVATPAGGLVAEVIRVGDFDELNAAGERARGRIVLFDKPIEGGFRAKNGYGSAAGLRVNGAIEAARLGAVGVLVRSLGTADFRLPHTGMMRYEEDVERIPAAAISAEDADLIRRLIDSGETVRVELTLENRHLPEIETANVIADLPGRERTDEIVLIACHLDSWDVGTGAMDDGAGCAIVMETVALLHRIDLLPRRTIRVVLFTNEEFGAHGGRAYAADHEDEMDRHVLAIEADMGGGEPLGFGVSAGEGGVAVVRDAAQALAFLEADRILEGGGGADISALRKYGVPLMGLHQESQRYFDYHHSPADTLDKIDRRELERAVAAMALMTFLLADLEEPLPRIPTD